MIRTLPSAPTSHQQPEILIGRQEYNAFFSFFVLEDEDDEEMVCFPDWSSLNPFMLQSFLKIKNEDLSYYLCLK